MLAFALGRPISGSGESWNARRDTKGGRPDPRLHRLRRPVAVSSGRHASLAAGVDLPGALRWLQPGDRRLAAEDRSGALGRADEMAVRWRSETARPGGDGPLWAEALGAVLILAAFYGWVTVLRANSFASTAVRLQPERGQTVISTGPYAVLRHPMYAYALLL